MKFNVKQTIYIVGAGAIGKALAVFLQSEGRPVILVRGSVDNQPDRENRIKVTNREGEHFHEDIWSKTFSNLDVINGLVVITAKAFANEEIAQNLKHKTGVFSIILLQNGLNIETSFSDFPEVYRCVLFATSQMMGENEVSFKAVAESPIGQVNGSSSNINYLIEQLNTTHFGFRSENDIRKVVWEKAIMNCAFNAICPILETDNGIFDRNEAIFSLAQEVVAECVNLAGEFGLQLNQNEVEEKLLFVSRRSAGQLISTYEDIRNGRRTEIESLNLAMADLADDIGKPDLVQKTRLLGQMVLKKSQTYLSANYLKG